MKISRPILLIALISFTAQSRAEGIALQKEALKEIRDTAADICANVDQEGYNRAFEVGGGVDAKVNGVIAQLADLGVNGAVKYKSQKFKGVLQEQLATALKTTSDCRRDVFDTLANRLLPNPKAPSAQVGKGVNNVTKQVTHGPCGNAVQGSGNVNITCN